jgi:hypothetical protein
MGHDHAYTTMHIYLGEKYKMQIAVVFIVVGNLLLLLLLCIVHVHVHCGVSVSMSMNEPTCTEYNPKHI